MEHTRYQNPLVARYASPAMVALWSDRRKIQLWRELWVFLAESQHELGLAITSEQVHAMRAQIDNIDWEAAARYERKFRHDVMAHVHTFGDACPEARGIIHWGATSCYVTDNADLILIREGLVMLRDRLLRAIRKLAIFAQAHRALPCLAYTHLQPAQPTTIGKRACLWIYDLVLDLRELEHRLAALCARSIKGTTGTQASFLQLFQGDHDRVRQLEEIVARKMGFSSAYAVTGQTYPRKIDAQLLAVLSGIAQSTQKAATDWRLLASQRELTEPIEANQIGSSAMAYKRNPMRSERICGLSRYVMSLESSASATAATQWLERTLDDSANRRLVIPQAFLACDAILMLYENVVEGMTFHPRVANSRLRDELPFMATEQLLMDAVHAGKDRQEIHERIRIHSFAAAERLRNENVPNDLWSRFQADPLLADVVSEEALDPARFIGRAPEQVDDFLREVIEPLWRKFGTPTASADPIHV